MGERDVAVTLPIEWVERLLELASTAPGNNNVPDLTIFSDVRRELELRKGK